MPGSEPFAERQVESEPAGGKIERLPPEAAFEERFDRAGLLAGSKRTASGRGRRDARGRNEPRDSRPRIAACDPLTSLSAPRPRGSCASARDDMRGTVSDLSATYLFER